MRRNLLVPLLAAFLAALLAPLASGAQPKPIEPAGVDQPVPAPIALSDPDGQDLVLTDLTVRAAVSGMLSLTELEMRFANPHDRRMEGRFSCVLPAGATVSRFAKEVNGRLMEGEVVERLRANKVYDQILQEMRDPALLEQDQGNRFSARVFPIEARGSVRLILSYTRVLPLQAGVRTFDLPLRGLPTIGRFVFSGVFTALPGERRDDLPASGAAVEGPSGARRATVQVLDMTEDHWTPKEDLRFRWRPIGAAAGPRVLESGDFALVTVPAPAVTKAAPAAAARKHWTFYVDTSASSAEGAAHRIAALTALLGALPSGDRVEVVAFDQGVAKVAEGEAQAVAKSIGPLLAERMFLGGTDLDAALADLAARAALDPDRRYVLVSDGVATLGRTGKRELAARLAGLPAATEVHALVLGSREDHDALAAIVEGRGRIVAVPFTEGLARAAREAAGKLAQPRGVTLELSDPAFEWIFPQRVTDVQPGDEVVAIGKRKAGASPAGGRDAKADVLPPATFAPLLEREGYRAYLAWLDQRAAAEADETVRRALATERVRISVEHRVLVPETTLLVLETEQDYRRFGLDRNALAEILTVGRTGIERADRTQSGPLEAVAAVKPATGPRRPPADDVDGTRSQSKVAAEKRSEAARPGSIDFDGDTIVADLVKEDREESDESGEAEAEVWDDGPAAAGQDRAARPRERSIEAFRGSGAGPSSSMGMIMGSGGSAAAPVVGHGRGGGGVSGRPLVPTKPSRPDWTTPARPTKGEVDDLLTVTRRDPGDRAAWNRLAEALAALEDWRRLREVAVAWQPRDPENPQVYESLGEAALHLGRKAEAARAFASLVEVAPGKTELLQRAGLLLLRAGETALAEFPLRRAVELRPDRVNGHRHLALLLWQQGRLEEAAKVLEEATRKQFPDVYGDVQRVVREELAYVYRAWLAREPARAGDIRERAGRFGADLARTDALRITLAWETDANDVDLHVVDPSGEECFYSHKNNASGLELYQDITRGFGPEVVRTQRLDRGKYSIGVNYFASGPMGVSRGILVVVGPVRDAKASPDVRILPFRLVEGGRDMRLLDTIDL